MEHNLQTLLPLVLLLFDDFVSISKKKQKKIKKRTKKFSLSILPKLSGGLLALPKNRFSLASIAGERSIY